MHTYKWCIWDVRCQTDPLNFTCNQPAWKMCSHSEPFVDQSVPMRVWTRVYATSFVCGGANCIFFIFQSWGEVELFCLSSRPVFHSEFICSKSLLCFCADRKQCWRKLYFSVKLRVGGSVTLNTPQIKLLAKLNHSAIWRKRNSSLLIDWKRSATPAPTYLLQNPEVT